jgi:hypothetical protein
MTDPTEPLTFTDADGATFVLLADSRPIVLLDGQRLRHAQLPDLIAALTPRGYAVVPVLGTEPTDEELDAIETEAHDAKIAEEVHPNSDSIGYLARKAANEAARRALYLAGSASRQPEIDDLRASERAAQERAGKLEDDLTQMRDLLSPDWQNQTELGAQVMLALKEARDEAAQAEERATTAEAELSCERDVIVTLEGLLEFERAKAETQRDRAMAAEITLSDWRTWAHGLTLTLPVGVETDHPRETRACIERAVKGFAAAEARVVELETELARVRAERDEEREFHATQASEQHRFYLDVVKRNVGWRDEARSKLAELTAVARGDALTSLIDAAEALVSWDWQRLLIDDPDSETAVSDAALLERRLPAAKRALESLAGEKP